MNAMNGHEAYKSRGNELDAGKTTHDFANLLAQAIHDKDLLAAITAVQFPELPLPPAITP